MTVLDLLHKVGVEDNVSFYDERGKRDVILNMVWHADFEDAFIKQLSGMAQGKKLENAPEEILEDGQTITLKDCFEEFRRPEMLDDENKWYCNKCKEHVRATKQMEIYKPPPILIVNLKRFKQSGNASRFFGMYSGGGYGQKIDNEVKFPLEGLDITELVLGHTDKSKPLIYDCYAVSNHYGNMGFGHYTAYAKNPIDKTWYEFDDSRVTPIRSKIESQVVGNAAYNLFFRRRDWHEQNMQELDYDKLAIKPDMEFLKQTEK